MPSTELCAGIAMASLGILRTILSPSSARLSLRGCKPSTFAFSSFQTLIHSSAVNRAVKVSTQQSGAGKLGAEAKFPRPKAIPWQEELSNKVNLIGCIGKPVQLKYTETGNAFASTTLGAKLNIKSPETTWFSLKFCEEMAEIAAEHVKTGDQVYVSGSMNLTGDDNNPSVMNQIVVSMLNFIERKSSFSPHMDVNVNSSISGSQQEGINMKHVNSGNKLLETEKSWLAFFANPTEWWDNRKDKKNPRAPDFKHKSTGEALWIESYSNPSWVKSKLDKLDEMKFSLELSKPKQSSSLFEDKDFDLFKG